MKNSHTTRNICIAIGITASCVVGLPNLYDKFLIARFIATAIGLAIVFLFALVRKKRWRVPNTPVFRVYLLFLLLCGCSIIWATNTAEAIFAFACQMLTPLIIILFYSLLSTHCQLTQKALWMGAAVVLAVYLFFTIVQLFYIESLSFEQLYRVSGINGHKNLLAAMLFVLSAFLFTSFSVFESKFPKVLSVVLFVVAIAVVIVLKSRAVLLSVMVASLFFGVLFLVRIRHCEEARRSNSDKSALRYFGYAQQPQAQGPQLLISVVLVYAFLTVGLRWFADHSVPHSTDKSEIETKMMSTSSLVERCLLWDKTYRIADKHPFAGCGIGNWQILFPDAGLKGLYRADVWNVNFTKPHNEYLGVLSETGYSGLFLYILFLVSLVIRAFFALCKTKDQKDFLYGGIVLSVFIGGCVNALFDFPNSRIEHIIWMGIFMAILFRMITQDRQKTLGKGWNTVFLVIAIMLVTIGGFRYKGERNTFEMQKAMKANDWKAVENHCHQAFSVFYTIDPVGLPLHWYQGKAEKKMGKPQAINSFRKAYHYAPYCKENLNDLGLAEYHTAHDLHKAEFYLNEAIRISPNYLYPYFNLAYIYLSENEPQKAQTVADGIYFDSHKCEVMKADAVFFEPFDTESARQKIDADYRAVMQLRRDIFEKLRGDSK
jgi:O-antigen ligase